MTEIQEDINLKADRIHTKVQSGEIHFWVVNAKRLPSHGQLIVGTYLTPMGIPWKLGVPSVDEAFILKVDNRKIGFIYVYPQSGQHVFTDSDHEPIDPDEAFLHLLQTHLHGEGFSSEEIKINPDRSIDIDIDGEKGRIEDELIGNARIISLKDEQGNTLLAKPVRLTEQAARNERKLRNRRKRNKRKRNKRR